MERKKMLRLTQTAMFSAIIVVMTFVPYIGYITYAPLSLSITTVHVPVIIGACTLGPVGGTILGLVWGVTSLLKSMTVGGMEMAIFLNPLVSVVPRILVGLIAAWCFIGLKKLIKNAAISYTVTGIVGTLSNTVLVLSAIQLFGSMGMFELGTLVQTIFNTIIKLNGVLEILLAAILVPVIGIAVRRVQKKMTT